MMNSIWVREDGTITDSDDPTAFEYISVEEYEKLEREASGLRVALSNLQHARSSRYYKVKADRDVAVERAFRADEENERLRVSLKDICIMWVSVCGMWGWEESHMVQYNNAIDLLEKLDE